VAPQNPELQAAPAHCGRGFCDFQQGRWGERPRLVQTRRHRQLL